MMATKKFELTERMSMALSNIQDHLRRYKDDGELEYHASKCLEGVLSMLEPVELEALGNKDMKEVIKKNLGLLDNPDKAVELLFKVSQSTNQKNQSKYGKLFRLKEV